jgi:recombination protein RecA
VNTPVSTDKLRAVKAAIGLLEKQFGKGSVMTLDADAAPEACAVIPSGSLGIDLALGCGGYPRGRIVEVYGPESSGKTTLALHAIAETQKLGGVAAFIDAEHALDVGLRPPWASTSASCSSSQPDNGEQALEVPTGSCARAPSTSWWSTPSRPSCRRRSSRATWATSTWASRRG